MDMSVKLNSVLSAPATQEARSAQPSSRSNAELPDVPTKEVQRPELEKAVSDIQEYVKASQRQLDFSVDDSTGTLVVKVIATGSGEVIRQLPSEAALSLARSLAEGDGFLLDDNV
ncbi:MULTISPECIES: flagellar protein FlaG [Pseudomonas]|jgi:flagellar protein FlaG|uniref:Flagellin FlaG n=2 Tax=Pseudomonas putida group TaxID=136845 RepID=Q88ES6_PSEPK|nr:MULTISPECIES: flagellar protein FlaG [Pseudomonas]AAN69955.1 putative Flagellin FlaG [Pseudomonas putida KT2440]KMU96746.1 flagellar protein FlaG [Pseudomonas putida]KMY30022.1 flagellar protein FlaG [Pseudomonas putida]MBP2841362.1 flagellar protein FlaG [Pseudomonas sp. PNP]MCE0864158.1 flagellar protein FlaG [Pseudomonas alloputida]